MAQTVTYAVNEETLENIAFIRRVRPEVSKSYLIRELIAREAKRIREEFRDKVA
jgi:hypothetical protein